MADTERDRLRRRHIVKLGAIGALGAGLVRPAAAAERVASPIDAGEVKGGKVAFPPWTAQTERPSSGPPNPVPLADRVGFAIMGLGRLSLEEILPAFAECKRARPVALVSGTPDKAKLVAAQYGIRPEAIYDYGTVDRIRDDPEIQVVYVVLPNALHREYTIRAAQAGKHVLFEKPMSVSSADAEAMIGACKAAGRKLMIAYRCQYEPHHRQVLELVRNKTYGPVRLIDAVNVQNMGDPTQWRFRKALAGGGCLPDIGLYGLNTARFLTGEEPVELFARTYSTPDDPRFAEVEETISFMLRFPSGTIANVASSYGMHEARPMGLHMPGASIELQNAFAYMGQRLLVSHRDGAVESRDERRLSRKNQFALEMDHMAQCVTENRTPHTPGEEGLQDHRLMEALYRSAQSGQPVSLPSVDGLDATRGPAPDVG